jgi:hypothetical protein
MIFLSQALSSQVIGCSNALIKATLVVLKEEEAVAE